MAVLLVRAPGVHAQAITNATWTGSGPGTDWSTATNWSILGMPGIPPSGAATNVFFTLVSGPFTSTVDSNYTVGNLDIGGASTSAFTLNSLGGSTLKVTNQVSNQDTNPVAVNISISGAGEFVMGIFGGGVGTLTLNSTSNTWSGVTRVDSGIFADGVANAFSPNSVLEVAGPGAVQVNFNETIGGLSDDVGANGSVVVASGAMLSMNGTFSTTFTGVISGSGGIAQNGGGTFGLSGNNTYTGPTVIGPGSTVSIGFLGRETGSIASPSVSGTGTLAFFLAGSYIYPGALSGGLNVLQEGSGFTTLSGTSNSYSGITTVNAGVLQDGAADAFSPNSLVEAANPGFLVVNFNEAIGGLGDAGAGNGAVSVANSGTKLVMTGNGGPYTTTFSGEIVGGGGIDLEGGNVLTLTGANNYSGPTTIGSGSLLVLGNGGATGSINSPGVSGGGTLEFNLSSNTAYAGVLSGALSVQLQGSGQVTLSGANTYSGGTALFAGTLADGAANSFSPNSPITVAFDSLLNVNFNETIAGISGSEGSGTVSIAGGAALDDATTGPFVFPGNITGAGSLFIGGSGSQTLSGDNTYSGGTTVQSEVFVGSSTVGPPGSITSGPVGTGTLTFTGGSSEISPSAPDVTLANAIVLNTDGAYVDNDDGGSNNLTLTGLLSGTGGFDWCATGALELTGANTFFGGVDMRDGTLLLGSSTVVVSGSIVSGPIGTALLTLENGTTLAAAIPSVALANPIFLEGGANVQFGTDDPNALNLTGTISGSGNITYLGSPAGSLTLGGNNSFSGTTTIAGGTVFANNNQAFGPGNSVIVQGGGLSVDGGITVANAVTVDDGSVVGGYGSIAPAGPETLTFKNGSTVVAGTFVPSGAPAGTPAPIGTLSFGANASLTLGPGGLMQFSIMNAGGVAGTGYGTISAPGSSVNITANNSPPSNEFTIQLVAVNAMGQFQLGSPASFNPGLPYTWTLLSAASISGFSPNDFAVDPTTDFSSLVSASQFAVVQMGNNLVLDFAPVPEPSTWALLVVGAFTVALFALRRRRA